MTRHINTIMDYSLFWILGVLYHYEAYGDLEFVRQVYPKMCSLMEFCEGQLDENGFLVGRENDWIYIDWADMDKTGALCAEQMLFAACWQTMAKVSAALGEENPEYMEKYLDITPGSVSVLGLMNDSEKKVQLLIDEDVIKEPYFGCHPCINTSSLKFTTEDLMQKIIPALEHEPVTVTLPVPE